MVSPTPLWTFSTSRSSEFFWSSFHKPGLPRESLSVLHLILIKILTFYPCRPVSWNCSDAENLCQGTRSVWTTFGGYCLVDAENYSYPNWWYDNIGRVLSLMRTYLRLGILMERVGHATGGTAQMSSAVCPRYQILFGISDSVDCTINFLPQSSPLSYPAMKTSSMDHCGIGGTIPDSIGDTRIQYMYVGSFNPF